MSNRLVVLGCLWLSACLGGSAVDTDTGSSTSSSATVLTPGLDVSCVVDADCVKVYADCSYCNCVAVNVADAWTYEDLACDDFTGGACDYDCALAEEEAAVCDGGTCVVVGG